jgi:predicted dithiol-disulfide oxidoreductase (DUF899 family)
MHCATEEQRRSDSIDFNYNTLATTSASGCQDRIRARLDLPPPKSWVCNFAAMTGTDIPTYTREAPDMSAFAHSDGVVYYTYFTYARGLDALWGMYQCLNRLHHHLFLSDRFLSRDKSAFFQSVKTQYCSQS